MQSLFCGKESRNLSTLLPHGWIIWRKNRITHGGSVSAIASANEPDAELPGVRSTTAQFQRNPKLLERVSMFLFLRDAFQQHSLLSTVTGHKTAETKVVQRVAIGIDFLVGFGGHSPESKLQHNPNEGQSVGNSISMADGPSVTRRQIAVMHFGGVLSEWPPPPVNVICETWH